MFETAELGRKASKQDFEERVPELRARLLRAQFALRQADFPAILLIAGVDGAGKGDTVRRLHEWLDPRGLETNVFGAPTDEERERPPYWRFWRTLPPKGKLGIYFGSWYTDPILRRTYRKCGRSRFERDLSRIAFFERMLVDDGALLVKFWFHLSKKAQRKRLESFESDPKTRWRVTPLDWKHHRLYDRFTSVCETALRQSDSGQAPWFVVEAADDRYRDLTVAQTLLDALERRLERPTAPPPAPLVAPAPSPPAEAGSSSVLATVDLVRTVSSDVYQKRLKRAQGRLGRLARRAFEKGVSTIAVFEGWDASGKGGNIRRITAGMDARLYRVVPIAAPTDEERAHHYLWRFWRHFPRAGHVVIFDRSWYGRVLVERVEGFAKQHEWQRAYLEINELEEQLSEHGTVVLKFWIHISPEEQLRRFEDREATAYKQHKITEEDWRNREKWKAYEAAVNEMVARTSTHHAPWTLVAGNDKKSARLQTLETLCARLGDAL
jgi:polyphosphate:AMP phosphotransferase